MTTQERIKKYGNPFTNPKWEFGQMVLWDIPDDINKAIPALPNKVYCHKIMPAPLEKTFRKLIELGLHKEIKTWDGCFNIRKQRGSTALSVHGWGQAVDLNAAWNGLGKPVQWSDAFVQVWRDLGWVCGADWKGSRRDGMHYQWDK
jgi:hypothetical protein